MTFRMSILTPNFPRACWKLKNYMIILGIDPGSRVTGFGVISVEKKIIKYIDSGTIRVKSESTGDRLLEIYRGIREIMSLYPVETAAIEQIFMSTNAQSALKLGQARGVALIAMAEGGLSIGEYTARQIKQSVVGYGAAEKSQVQAMIQAILKLSKAPSTDASDALACAICHYHTSQSLIGLIGASKIVRGRLQ